MIEVTEEMIQILADALCWPYGASWYRDALEAVFALVDPVPDDVKVIHGGDGGDDDYARCVSGSNVYRAECGCYYTYAQIAAMGPVSWEGK